MFICPSARSINNQVYIEKNHNYRNQNIVYTQSKRSDQRQIFKINTPSHIEHRQSTSGSLIIQQASQQTYLLDKITSNIPSMRKTQSENKQNNLHQQNIKKESLQFFNRGTILKQRQLQINTNMIHLPRNNMIHFKKPMIATKYKYPIYKLQRQQEIKYTKNYSPYNIKQKSMYKTNTSMKSHDSIKSKHTAQQSKTSEKSIQNILIKNRLNREELYNMTTVHSNQINQLNQGIRIDESFIIDRSLRNDFKKIWEIQHQQYKQALAYQRQDKIMVSLDIYQRQKLQNVNKQLHFYNKIHQHENILSLYHIYFNEQQCIMIKQPFLQIVQRDLHQFYIDKLLNDIKKALTYLEQCQISMRLLNYKDIVTTHNIYKIGNLRKSSQKNQMYTIEDNLRSIKQSFFV